MKRFFKIIALTALVGVLLLSNSSSAQAMSCTWYHSVKDKAGNRIGASHYVDVYPIFIAAQLKVTSGVLDEVQQWHNIESTRDDISPCTEMFAYCEYFYNFTGTYAYLVYPADNQDIILSDRPDWGICKDGNWDWSNGFAVPVN